MGKTLSNFQKIVTLNFSKLEQFTWQSSMMDIFNK